MSRKRGIIAPGVTGPALKQIKGDGLKFKKRTAHPGLEAKSSNTESSLMGPKPPTVPAACRQAYVDAVVPFARAELTLESFHGPIWVEGLTVCCNGFSVEERVCRTIRNGKTGVDRHRLARRRP